MLHLKISMIFYRSSYLNHGCELSYFVVYMAQLNCIYWLSTKTHQISKIVVDNPFAIMLLKIVVMENKFRSV